MSLDITPVLFADKDSEAIVEGLISRYEAAAGVTLYPGDPVRLFLETIAYIISYQRSLIDFTGKMNLLAYSSGNYLDHLGAFVGVTRLTAAPAVCTVRFTLSAPQIGSVIIPSGTRVSAGGNIYFATDAVTEIPEGDTYVDISVTAVQSGSSGNGLLSGQINVLVDPLPFIQSVANTSATTGGTDTETDDNFRERIQLAPESFSVAGPAGAYEFWARSAHPGISSVAVNSPTPGVVDFYPLLTGGEIPPDEIVQVVENMLTDEQVRPLTDDVHVYAPTASEYTLSVTYYIDRTKTTTAASIQAAVEAAVDAWILWQRERLGRDINPSELIHRMILAGAKRVVISSPAYTAMAFNQLAVCESRTVTFGGLEDG